MRLPEMLHSEAFPAAHEENAEIPHEGNKNRALETTVPMVETMHIEKLPYTNVASPPCASWLR